MADVLYSSKNEQWSKKMPHQRQRGWRQELARALIRNSTNKE
jgi:hypothetical protein